MKLLEIITNALKFTSTPKFNENTTTFKKENLNVLVLSDNNEVYQLPITEVGNDGDIPDATTSIKGKIKLAGDLSGTADLPTVPGLLTKQDTLISGTNIKTLEGQSLLGTGNIDLTKSDVGLNNVDNTSDLNKPISNATQLALNLKQNLSEKNQVNGYAGLGSDGKIISSQVPAIAITDTFIVNSEAAMLALTTAEQGDVAIRTDINKTFILQFDPYSSLVNWKELLSPTDSVTSVFGRQGVVVAVNGDYTTALVTETINKNYQTDNQKLFNDATSSIQTQIDSKTTIGTAFTAGRIPYTTSPNTIVDSSRLLWINVSSILEINGNNPVYRIKNNLNNYAGEFSMNAGGALFYKNHQGKNIFTVTNPVSVIEQPQFAIGQVSVIPAESQLYVYGGTNGANIDARGLDTVDEANIDLQGNDWESSGVPNSLGFSYFGSNGRPGTVLGYAKNKLAQIRFQNASTALITSINEDSSITPIRFGINTIEVVSISNNGLLLNTETANTIAGFDASKQVKSLNTSTYPSLSELAFVKGVTSSIQTQLNGKQPLLTNPLTGTGVSGQVSYWNGVNSQAGSNKFVYNEPTNVLTLNANSGFFDVARTNNGTNATPNYENILRYGASGFYAYIQGGNSFTTNQGTFLKFITNSGTGTLNEALTINSSGNVGVGTSSPLNRLHLSGDTFNNSRLVIERTSVGTTGRFSMGVQNTINQFGISDEVQGLDRLVISPTGLIGMGITSPNYNLHINSANVSTFLQISSATTGNTLNDGLIIGNDATGNALFLNKENTSTRFSNNNVEVMRIHPSGGVSIGNTTDPGVGGLALGTSPTLSAGTHEILSRNISSGVVEKVTTIVASATLDFPNTAAGTSSDLTITLTGAALGDTVMLGVPFASVVPNGIFTAFVSAVNTVTVRFGNLELLTARDPASGTFKVRIMK